jgi:vitamin K-dependent gamma-carboxylase
MTDAGAKKRLWVWLFAPTDIAGLVAFRIAFGLTVAVSATRFLAYHWVDPLFVRPTFQFSYWGFSWLPAASGATMHGLFIAIAVLGLCVAVGAFYRLSVGLLACAFTYVQLSDVANYLNHYYLVCLLTVLMFVVPAHRAFSVDAWRRPLLQQDFLPAWCTYLLRFQVGVVYVFAGLAKLNADWLLDAQPLGIWLAARTSLPLVGPFLDERWVAYAASWFGFLFDTTIVAFLLAKRTRPFAYAVLVGFHAATALLFPIGMFPVIMTTAAWVFFDPSWPRRLLKHPSPLRVPTSEPPIVRPFHRVALLVAVLYATWQIFMPLRAHLYGENVSWHEQGMRFSWRVMTREKNGSVTYIVRDPVTGREWHVPPRKYLTSLQERELSVQPDLILQLAHHIAGEFAREGKPHVQVFADAHASLNGRPAALLISPDVDLARERDSLARKRWIAPAP